MMYAFQVEFCDGQMVDFFTGEPSLIGETQLPRNAAETLMKLLKSWKRVICNNLILGFDLLNLSKK